MILFLFLSVGLGTWALAIAFGLGYPWAARALPRSGAATRLSAAFLIGTALLSYAVLALGLWGSLRPIVMLALLSVLTIPSAWQFVALRRVFADVACDVWQAYRQSSLPVRILSCVVALLVALSAVAPLLPVTNADALAYATATPARFALDGAMRFHPDSYESAFVLLVEQLHTIGYVFGLRPVGVWFEVAAQVLLVAAARECYRAFSSGTRPGTSLVYGVALLAIPLTQLMPFMAKAHLVELLAIVVVMTVVLEAPEKGGWYGAAACAGICVATKYSAGPGLASMLAPAVSIALWRSRMLWRPGHLLGLAAVALLLAAPVYLRNWWWTGDPLFPMHVAGFTSPFHLRHQDDWIASLYYLDSGFGRRPSDLLLWWPRAAILAIRGSASYMGTFALAFLPLAFGRSRAPHTNAVAAGFALSTVMLFVAGSQFERYFLAPIAAMTLLAVAGWDGWRPVSRWVEAAGLAILMGLALGVTLPQKAYGLFVQGPALFSFAGEARVLDATTPFHADFVRIHDLVPPDAPVVCLLRNCQYLVNYRREDALFRLTEANQAASGHIDPRPVYAGLRAQGLRYLVAYDSDDGQGPPASVVDWLARCAGTTPYRNTQARFGTRDPRRVRYGAVRLIALSDALTADGAALSGPCLMPVRSW